MDKRTNVKALIDRIRTSEVLILNMTDAILKEYNTLEEQKSV